MTNFEILMNLSGRSFATAKDRTTIRANSIAEVADYLRPGLPDVVLAKMGYTTWQIRTGNRIIGSVQDLG